MACPSETSVTRSARIRRAGDCAARPRLCSMRTRGFYGVGLWAMQVATSGAIALQKIVRQLAGPRIDHEHRHLYYGLIPLRAC